MKIRTANLAVLLVIAFFLSCRDSASSATVTLHYGTLQGNCSDQEESYTWTIYATATASVPNGTYCIADPDETGCIGYVHVSNGHVTDQNGAVYAESYPAQGSGQTSSRTYHIFGHSDWGSVTIIKNDLAAENCGSCSNPTCNYHQHYTVSDTIYLGGVPNLPADPGQFEDCHDNTGCGGNCPNSPMASYSIHLLLASLRIQDTPVSFRPPFGPPVDFKVSYHHRDTNQPASFDFSNFGPKWTFNWLSYVTDDPNNSSADAKVYVRGGGVEVFGNFDSGTNSYAADPQTMSVLVRTSGGYERRFPDGSKEVYGPTTDGSTACPRRVFLTSVVDAIGNAVTLEYDGLRLVRIKTDLFLNLPPTTLSYDLTDDPFKITKVTDPFGRFAQFDYTNGELTKITDPVGIESRFHYSDGTDFIDSMTTPYGTTTFTAGQDGDSLRWIEATDPRGGKERVEYNNFAAGISSSEASAPAGVTNRALDHANTFYWDKRATDMFPPVNGVYDYSKAKVIHWLTSANGAQLSGIKHSEKRPLESRVWYSYVGQPDGDTIGTTARQAQVARILDDGSTQAWQYQYNTVGNLTQSIDPRNRRMSYDYDTNGIDLLHVRQTTGSNNDLLRSVTYYPNGKHEIYVDTDAAGEPTTYAYNDHGQILTVQNAKNEITTYSYGDGADSNIPVGYLASISSPDFNGSHAVTRLEYDDANRVRTVQNDPDGYRVTTDYDDIDRPTQTTYPDGTTQQFEYSQDFGGGPTTILDLTASKDRDERWTYRHYNGNRQMDSVTDPLGQTTLYDWCTCGSLVGITDPNGNLTSFNLDVQKRVYQKVFADNTSINYLYEGQSAPNTVGATSRLKSMTDALNQATNYSYFPDDDVQQISYANANKATPTVNYIYDPNYNRVTSMTDGIGTTAYTYYPVSSGTLGAGKIHQVDGPFANDTITYSYDELGRALGQDVNGTSSTVSYDSLGRIYTTSNPLGEFTRNYESDVTSRLHAMTYPNGQIASYSYFDNDGDRRLQTLQNLANDTSILSEFDYTYDAEGQIQSLVGPFQGWQLGYDNAKRLTDVTLGPGNGGDGLIGGGVGGGGRVSLSYGFHYGYDAAGNRTTNLTVTPYNRYGPVYPANNLNQLSARSWYNDIFPAGPSNPGPGTPITYDANGNMTYDGSNQTFEWDAANRLVAINYVDTGNRTEFAYDGLGRRVKIIEMGPGIIAVVQPADGNYHGFSSSPFTLPAGTYTLSFEGLNPNGGDNTAFVDGVALNNTFVANGSFESPTTGNYVYDPSDTTWSYQSSAGLVHNGSDFGNANAPFGSQAAFIQGTGSLSQTFDSDGGTFTLSFQAAQRAGFNPTFQQFRVTLQPWNYPTNVKTFVWSGNTIAEERDATGANVTKRFFTEGEQRVGGADAGNYYYTRDHLGSIREVTDSTGALITQLDYDAWGNEVVVQGNLNIDFGYTGDYFHQPSGMNLAMYRTYNPTIGRWISRDPIEESAGPNLYAYVSGDPVGKIDPLGLAEQPEPPYHPPPGTRVRCLQCDSCPEIDTKMGILSFMISTHMAWDIAMPFPNGGNRHLEDIRNLLVAYMNCAQIRAQKNCAGRPPFIAIPLPSFLPKPSQGTTEAMALGAGGALVIGGPELLLLLGLL